MMPTIHSKESIHLDRMLEQLLIGKSLSCQTAQQLFTMIFNERIPFAKAKTFLLLLSQKGETADELLGCLQALQSLEKSEKSRIPGLMDTCGTGGDGRHTLNISTLAALVIAAAGGKVAKHGNRAISSKSGSSDLMEAFGIQLQAPRAKMIRAIKDCGIGYFHAPCYHPVFLKMQPLRRSLKRRTILNFLGPLANPMDLDYQLVGVSRKEMVPLYAKVLSQLGRKATLVCHSLDGTDEISTSSPTKVAWVFGKRIQSTVIQPRTYGLKKTHPRDISVDSVKESKALAEKILSGKEKGPARDVILLNAAFGLFLCRKARNIQEGIRLALTVLDTGRALHILKQLKKISNETS